ncbi:uncharacterized protein LOC103318172 [Nasonia vitripennis]|uniref:Uncharacterized protein n=1 Tax=Nasonia vitripennis TaxID=7425 RepID=A0A7M7Q4K4_NASVI|nr:uncharacterized protein LOC103318172 [Nasonia vitripennis]
MSKNTGAIPVAAAVSKLSDLMPSTLSRSFFSQPVSQMDAPPPKNLKKEKKKDKKGKKSKDKMDKKDKKKKTKQDKRAKLEANKRLSSSQPDVLLSSSSSWQTRNNGFSASQPQPTLNKKLQEQRASTSKQQQLPKQGLSTRPPMDFQEPNAVGISASSSTAPLTAPDTAQMAKILERIDSMNRRIVTVGATASHLSTKTDNLENHSKSVDERLANIEKLMSSMHEMLKEITNRQKRKVAVRPQYLPFKTLADILAFNFVGAEAYAQLVDYLISLGGANYTDSAARYMKECVKVDEDIFRHLTWCSSKRDGILALKETDFAKACREAMPADKKTLLAPQDDDFASAMTKSLKSAKGGFRRKMKRPAQNLALYDQLEVQRQRLDLQLQRQEANERDHHDDVIGGEDNGANDEDNGANAEDNGANAEDNNDQQENDSSGDESDNGSSDESSTDDRSSGTEDDNNARVSDSDATDIFRETHSNYL